MSDEDMTTRRIAQILFKFDHIWVLNVHVMSSRDCHVLLLNQPNNKMGDHLGMLVIRIDTNIVTHT